MLLFENGASTAYCIQPLFTQAGLCPHRLHCYFLGCRQRFDCQKTLTPKLEALRLHLFKQCTLCLKRHIMHDTFFCHAFSNNIHARTSFLLCSTFFPNTDLMASMVSRLLCDLMRAGLSSISWRTYFIKNVLTFC
jgi:hypothetical protein